MSPTVGRIVHYHPGRDEKPCPILGLAGGPYAAIVTSVESDEVVSLKVFGKYGDDRRSMVLKGPRGDASAYWDWPERK